VLGSGTPEHVRLSVVVVVVVTGLQRSQTIGQVAATTIPTNGSMQSANETVSHAGSSRTVHVSTFVVLVDVVKVEAVVVVVVVVSAKATGWSSTPLTVIFT
jgi:hypothetical protein